MRAAPAQAVLGTGIERSRVGDIIVQGERGAQVVTTPEMAEYLQGMLTQARALGGVSEARLSDAVARA